MKTNFEQSFSDRLMTAFIEQGKESLKVKRDELIKEAIIKIEKEVDAKIAEIAVTVAREFNAQFYEHRVVIEVNVGPRRP